MPSSRRSIKEYQKSPNDILASWMRNAGTPATLRDDTQDIYKNNQYIGNALNSDCSNIGRGQAVGSNLRPNLNTNNNSINRQEMFSIVPDVSDANAAPIMSGITFSDQRKIGRDPQYSYIFNQYFHALNPGPIFGGAIGYSTPETDERLLSRRIFRNNERGVENGIPMYEKALYTRNYDRDASEGLRSSERDCIIQKYDMQSLYDRVEEMRKWKMTHAC